jgi:hypothetical protein
VNGGRKYRTRKFPPSVAVSGVGVDAFFVGWCFLDDMVVEGGKSPCQRDDSCHHFACFGLPHSLACLTVVARENAR